MKKKYLGLILIILIFISIEIAMIQRTRLNFKEDDIAIYVDNKKIDSYPNAGNIAFKNAVCENDVDIYWDNDSWELVVNDLSKKVKCNLYFVSGENAVSKITDLSKSNSQFASDDTDKNIRYIGKDPDNYIYFNCSDYSNQSSDTCEAWRIIGVFNNVTKEGGTKENLIKIIRNDNIGKYPWDTSDASINEGNGSNDWTSSTLNYLMNPGHTENAVGGSLYYYAKSGLCYYGNGKGTIECDFTSTGLKNDATRNAIETVSWNIGGTNSYVNSSNGLASHWYNYERGTTVYSGRATTWIGKVGLMYPSDYGYATSGSLTTSRSTCLAKELYNWDSLSDCYNNDYLYKESYHQWLMSPCSGNASNAYRIYNAKVYHGYAGNFGYMVRPALYIKSNLLIIGGNGTSDSPYELGIN